MEEALEVHVISDGKLPLKAFAEKAAQMEPHVDYFHLREKNKSAIEIFEGVQWLYSYGIPSSKIIVNDRVDVAYTMNVVGVQLPWHSLDITTVKNHFPKLRIGRSVHSIKEAKSAEANGADYVIFGHIFPSSSKPNLPARGVTALEEVVSEVTIPVIAIGGIQPSHTPTIIRTKAKGIAVMSGVLAAADPFKKIQAYIERSQYDENPSKW